MSEAWIDDVVTTLERRIAGGDAQPDFLDVVSRAHALDPEAFDEAALERAEALELAHAEETDDEDDAGELDAWIGDVRGAMERRVQQRRGEPVPPVSQPAPRRAIWWVGGAVAAAVLLALGIGGLMSTSASQHQETLDQAVRISEPSSATGNAVPAETRSDAPDAPPLGVAPLESIDGDASSGADEEQEQAETDEDPEAEAETDGDAVAARRRAGRADRLTRLSEQAQEQWRAGRRKEAARLFGEVVRRGGRSHVAEMALADLFTLAYQLGDTDARRKHWRTYLRRFPRGRFADDARAGLCRTAAAGVRAGCWQGYLDDFPRGSYRAEARAATEAP